MLLHNIIIIFFSSSRSISTIEQLSSLLLILIHCYHDVTQKHRHVIMVKLVHRITPLYYVEKIFDHNDTVMSLWSKQYTTSCRHS